MTTAFDEEGVVAGLWEQVDALAASRVWQPDEVIYREGEPPAGVHIIRSGQIDLVYAARNLVVKPLRESTRGDILGLSEAVGASAYVGTAIARSRCETGFLPVTRLNLLLDEQPERWFCVLRLLSEDVVQSRECLRRRGETAGLCHSSHPRMTSVMP